MRLTEIFRSIQGEGTLIGTPMVFVRTNRCNLRCRWCDSTYTFEGGYEAPLSDLVAEVLKYREEWVCFTGGEPLLQRDAVDFVKELVSGGKKVLIETGGSLPVDAFDGMDGVVIDMDIKTPSSGEEKSLKLSNLDHLEHDDYVKFVISGPEDLDYAFDFLGRNSGRMRCQIIMQPAWGTDLKWLTEQVLASGLDVRVLPQLHKLIWGEIPGV